MRTQFHHNSKMVDTIPPELYRLKGPPDHPLRGTLALESAKRTISHRLHDRYDVIQCMIPDIDIPILSIHNEELAVRSMFMAYHYSSFALGPGELPPSKKGLAGSMLGLFFNTIDPTSILAFNKELSNHCIKAGFRPIFRVI